MTHIPYPDAYRCPLNSTAATVGEAVLRYLEDVVFKTTVNPDEVAAIVVEPIQGEGGYIVPPADFLSGLERIAQKHGILIVADEVQCGMGRTGTNVCVRALHRLSSRYRCSGQGRCFRIAAGRNDGPRRSS